MALLDSMKSINMPAIYSQAILMSLIVSMQLWL
jgi:hypothetical protein